MDTKDRLKSRDWKIGTFIELVRNQNYQIPTFQREFEWEPQSIKKLWDSILSYYPVGSLLIWKTDTKLHNHRKIGGFAFSKDDEPHKDFQYILDGQQRTTSLFASYEGLVINDFDYTLFFDLTQKEDNFCFQSDAKRRTDFKKGLIVKVKDIDENVEKISELLEKEFSYNSTERFNFRKIQNCLNNYPIMITEIKGIHVKEVCEIFQRINQEGKRLDIVDILVAKTFRSKDEDSKNPSEFYLRDLLKKLKSKLYDEYKDLDEFLIMQMIALHINKSFPDAGVSNITEKYLQKITAEQIEFVWEESVKAITETVRLFSDRLNLRGPNIIPYNYLYIPISYYFYKNKNPDYEFVKQWFWRTCFDIDRYSRADQVIDYCDMFDKLRDGESVNLKPLTLNKQKFKNLSYGFRNAYANAIISFYAYLVPLDFEDSDFEVLKTVYLTLGDKPNLHHIFPSNFLDPFEQKKEIKYSKDSLMNICYLRQKTNLKISDDSPENYFKLFADKNPKIKDALDSHLISGSLLELKKFTATYYDKFIDQRTDMLTEKIKENVDTVKINIIDEIE